MDKVQLVIEIFTFVILLAALFYASSQKRITNAPKWIITICSIGILALADRIKLIMWLATVGIIYLIKYLHPKKQQHGRTA